MLSLANVLRCFCSLLYRSKWLDLKQHYRTVATGRRITIEDISKKLSNFEKSVLDPQELLKSPNDWIASPRVLQHLQWMLKQDSLDRDMLLLGPPGPMLHWVLFQFSKLPQRELEYAGLSRDISQIDLHQRCETQNRTNVCLEQRVARAAIQGNILVIEDIDKIDRNVMPVLNNLLESREIRLQDGRCIISALRYDRLQTTMHPKEVKKLDIVRASEKFRVIGLVSDLNSSSLDRLRQSGFQARHINQTQEELKFYKKFLFKLVKDKTRKEIKLPLTLDDGQQTDLLNYAKSIDGSQLESVADNDNFSIIYKKSAAPTLGQPKVTLYHMPHLRLSESSIEAIEQLVIGDSICNESEQRTIFQSNESQDFSSHLPHIYGNSNSRIQLTIPPMIELTDEIRTVRESLPIYEYCREILDAIGNHQVVVISGETGSGKTTQVPQYIMEDCSANHQECRIICMQPRRMAATSIASRISVERNDLLGRSVGYQIRFDSQVSPTTNLILTTTGFLLRCLTGSKQDDVYKNLTHLIFDEVHERGKDTDFLLIAIRDALQVNPHLKVILMSATLDAEQLSQYFGGCPVINVPGRLFDVETMYLDDVLMKTDYKIENEFYVERLMKSFDGDDADAKAKMLRKFTLDAYQSPKDPTEIDHELLHHVIRHIHTHNSTDGSILVFLPGYEDIMKQKRKIETNFHKENYRLFVLHSGVNRSSDFQHERIYDRMPTGIRKIILSTNIAETSVTIKDVVHVVDAGKVKQQSYDSISDTTSLTTTDISQACAKQRAGRAGRIQNGFCYRLYSQKQYEAMEKYALPEILRVPLTEVCLNAKLLAENVSIEEYLLKALQPPPVHNIRRSIELLKKIDALDFNENITDLGIHLANMPVDCQLGKMILYSIMLRCLDPVVTIVSALSSKDPFTKSVGDQVESITTKEIKREFSKNSLSDHLMLLNAFNEWSWSSPQMHHHVAFCERNCISDANMLEINNLRRLIMRHLRLAEFITDDESALQKLNENSEKWEIVRACITAGLYPNVGQISKEKRRISAEYNNRMVPHSSSIVHGKDSNGRVNVNVLNAETDWLVYSSQSRISRLSFIRNITVVPAIDVILFGGTIIMLERTILPTKDNNGDTIFHVDDWIRFIVNHKEANLLLQLRFKFSSVLLRFLHNHREFQLENKEIEMLEVLTQIIQQEDNIEQRIRSNTMQHRSEFKLA